MAKNSGRPRPSASYIADQLGCCDSHVCMEIIPWLFDCEAVCGLTVVPEVKVVLVLDQLCTKVSLTP